MNSLEQLMAWVRKQVVPTEEQGIVAVGLLTYLTRRAIVRHCLARLPRGARVLEIGSGEGLTIKGLSRRTDLKLHGLELRFDLIQHTRNQFNVYPPPSPLPSPIKGEGEAHWGPAHSPTFVQGNALTLPFPSQTFDAVICVNLLISIPAPSWDTLIKECFRVSKPNQPVFFDIRNSLNPLIWLQTMAQPWLAPHLSFTFQNTSPFRFADLLRRHEIKIGRHLPVGAPVWLLAPVILFECRRSAPQSDVPR